MPDLNPATAVDQHNPTTLLLGPDRSQSILSETTAAALQRLGYSPFGTQRATGSPQSQLGFNGELRERPQGWYHLGNGHRIYNPVLRRFHSPDRLSPFGAGGLNPYAYCLGDPVNYTDPTGREVEAVPAMFMAIHALAILMGTGSLVLPLFKKTWFASLESFSYPLLTKTTSPLDGALSVLGIASSVSGLTITAIGIEHKDVSSQPFVLAAGAITIAALVGRVGVMQMVPQAGTRSPAMKSVQNFVYGRKKMNELKVEDANKVRLADLEDKNAALKAEIKVLRSRAKRYRSERNALRDKRRETEV